LNDLPSFSAQLAELIKYAGQVLRCVSVHLDMNQGGTNCNCCTQRFVILLHGPTNEPWSETKDQVDLTYFVGFLGHHSTKNLYVHYLCKSLTYGHHICITAAFDVDAPTISPPV